VLEDAVHAAAISGLVGGVEGRGLIGR
jgi:hypothetical protein